MQLVFHIPAINVNFPANAAMVYGSLISITNFNFIPEDVIKFFYVWNYYLTDNEEEEELRMLEEEYDDEEEILYSNFYRRILQEEIKIISSSIENSFVDEDGIQSSSLARVGYESDLFVENIESNWVIVFIIILVTLINSLLCPYYMHHCKCSQRCV